MASSSFLSVSLCFLVLFHSCFAQIEKMTSQRIGQEQPEARTRQQRYELDECQISRLNAVEPSRRIKSEAGTTEIWDENDQGFRCTGVAALRLTIHQNGLLVPSYSNAPRLFYVVQGSGLQGAAFPGCPETFQSSSSRRHGRERRQESLSDQHQKVREIQEGEILAIPAGVVNWIYNNGNTSLVIVAIMDTSNPANQLDLNFRLFFLAGNPSEELQGQISQSQRGRQQQGESSSVLSGFDRDLLAQALDIDEDLAERIQNQQSKKGVIVQVEGELQVVSPQQQEEEEYRWRGGSSENGFEETICNARLAYNVNRPSSTVVYNPRAGRLSNVNSFNLPILAYLHLSAQKGVLYSNAMLTPHWNPDAHSINYVIRGRGRVQIVNEEGQVVFDGEVREGQIFVVPQNFAALKKASEEGLEWISFKTNDHAELFPLAGRLSALKAMPAQVLAVSYQVSMEEARRIKNSRQEIILLSPGSGSPRQ